VHYVLWPTLAGGSNSIHAVRPTPSITTLVQEYGVARQTACREGSACPGERRPGDPGHLLARGPRADV